MLSETFGAAIDDATLRAARKANSGYRVKFAAKAGPDEIVYVTPEMVIKQLIAIDEFRSHVTLSKVK
jgi:hypothetical protein